MDSRLLAYAEQQAPRYTSYPTAPHFTSHIDGSVYRRWLGALKPTDPLSLYLHVPYCREICWYCGCNTHAARRDEPLHDYVETLLKEIDLTANALNARRVVEMHWGGGTPNILPADAFSRIVQTIHDRFDTSSRAQHAVELDPRHLDARKAGAYAAAGVNRASLGVQDLNPHVQRAIGRVQPLETVTRAISLLRDAGVAEISIDLMYGLPNQGEEEIRRSIELVTAMHPDRIALFGYAHVPWFKKRQRLIPDARLPGAIARYDHAALARDLLETAGYAPVGLDHFALPSDPLAIAARTGHLQRSFQGYVVEQPPAIIGLGPSAISTLPFGYAQNLTEPGAWARTISNGGFATARGHALTNDDIARRRLIDQIMCDFAGDLTLLGGAKACERELNLLAPLIRDGIARLEDERVLVCNDSRAFCRLVAMAFDAYAGENNNGARHSRAV